MRVFDTLAAAETFLSDTYGLTKVVIDYGPMVFTGYTDPFGKTNEVWVILPSDKYFIAAVGLVAGQIFLDRATIARDLPTSNVIKLLTRIFA